jgi:hypothetical protein
VLFRGLDDRFCHLGGVTGDGLADGLRIGAGEHAAYLADDAGLVGGCGRGEHKVVVEAGTGSAGFDEGDSDIEWVQLVWSEGFRRCV